MKLTGLVGGRRLDVASLLALILIVFFLFNSHEIGITGFVVYKNTSVEENTADGEGMLYPNGTWGTNLTGSFVTTQTLDGDEFVDRLNGKLKWDYYFITNYNETQPAKIEIISRFKVTTTESINVTIYNYNNSETEYLYETSTSDYESMHTNLTYPSYNLSHYVNESGYMQVAFEDDDRSTGFLRVDFLAINVTVSPFWASWASLIYTNGSAVEQGGLNFTRSQALNMSVRWNASDYSVLDGTVILNNSNSGGEEEYNVSLMADFAGFGGNYTNYTLSLSNSSLFRVGGNWTVRMRGRDSFYQQNTSMAADFGLWAFGRVTDITTNETGNRTLGNREIQIYCRVLDNESDYQVRAYNVSFYNGSGYIGSASTNSSGWASQNYTETSTVEANYTLRCNITDQPEILYNASVEDNQTLTLEIIEDPYPPIINSFSFQYINTATNITNLYANLSIVANVTDNTTSIASVKANITYPDGGVAEATMRQNSEGMWLFYFNTSNTEIPVNTTGVYGVNLSAWDLSGNMAHIDWAGNDTNFTAYSHLNVTLDHYVNSTSTYNRGEALALYARDVNGIIMTGLSWTVNLTRHNQDEANLSGADGAINYTIAANASDPTGNWTLEVINVTGAGANEGNGTFRFNISRALTPYFLPELYQDRNYGPSQDVNTVTPVYVRVNLSRGANTNYTMSVNLSYNDVNYTLEKGGSPTYSNSSMVVTSPGSYSTYFTLYAYAGDGYNNSGSASMRLVTSAQPGGGNGGGGGGGYIEVVVNATSCNCTIWESIGCSISGCGINDMYQERACLPSGCANESRCLANHSACISLVRDFNMTSDRASIEMDSGESETLTITLFNTGEANLSINITVERECCEVSFLERTLNLSRQASLDIPLVIHPELLEKPGSYVITMAARYSSLEKTRAVRVRVNSNPLLAEADRLKGELAALEGSIAEYRASGVYTGELEGMAGGIGESLEEAESSIAGDRLDVLRESITLASSGMEGARARLSGLWLQKAVLDNRWWIALGLILAVITSYLTAEVMVPYHRLTREIRRLSVGEREMVQKRKEIQRQYFMGKINEQAFNEMLISEQGRILGARGKAIEKARERKKLIREKLSVRALWKWLRGGPGGLARRVRRIAKRQGKAKNINKKA